MMKYVLCALLLAAAVSCDTVTIGVSGLTFSPDSATAKVGDTISFTGIDRIHNVVQVDGPNEVAATDGGFSSGAIGAVPSFEFELTQDMANGVDTLYYICEAHVGVGMRGQIAITAASTSAPSTSVPSSEAPISSASPSSAAPSSASPSSSAPSSQAPSTSVPSSGVPSSAAPVTSSSAPGITTTAAPVVTTTSYAPGVTTTAAPGATTTSRPIATTSTPITTRVVNSRSGTSLAQVSGLALIVAAIAIILN